MPPPIARIEALSVADRPILPATVPVPPVAWGTSAPSIVARVVSVTRLTDAEPANAVPSLVLLPLREAVKLSRSPARVAVIDTPSAVLPTD